MTRRRLLDSLHVVVKWRVFRGSDQYPGWWAVLGLSDEINPDPLDRCFDTFAEAIAYADRMARTR